MNWLDAPLNNNRDGKWEMQTQNHVIHCQFSPTGDRLHRKCSPVLSLSRHRPEVVVMCGGKQHPRSFNVVVQTGEHRHLVRRRTNNFGPVLEKVKLCKRNGLFRLRQRYGAFCIEVDVKTLLCFRSSCIRGSICQGQALKSIGVHSYFAP